MSGVLVSGTFVEVRQTGAASPSCAALAKPSYSLIISRADELVIAFSKRSLFQFMQVDGDLFLLTVERRV